MKGLAIVRESMSESVNEQMIKIGQYAQSERINIVHLDIRVDDNFDNIIHSLEVVDVVIVTDTFRVTNRPEAFEEFNNLLDQFNVKFINISQ